jgi:hypothetical protein
MGEETAHHILFECEALGRIRYSVLGPPGFELETIHQEPIKPPARPNKESRNFLWDLGFSWGSVIC